MTWSLPEGSLISGFHSEENPARPSPPPSSHCFPHIALRGTWTGSPGRWCCWPCRRTPQRPCTGCSSGSVTTRGRGCAPPCARPGSAGREGPSEPEAGRGRETGPPLSDPSLTPLSSLCQHLTRRQKSQTKPPRLMAVRATPLRQECPGALALGSHQAYKSGRLTGGEAAPQGVPHVSGK
uniref:Uncharacterized protein n=1 Tax=Sus scrofa TaxID=9823 RepID=A0A8D1B9C4_PIG